MLQGDRGTDIDRWGVREDRTTRAVIIIFARRRRRRRRGGGGTPGGEEDVGVGEEAEIDARECEEDGDRIGEVRERRARELYRDTWHESPGLAKIKGMRIIFSFFCFVDPTGRDSSAVLTPERLPYIRIKRTRVEASPRSIHSCISRWARSRHWSYDLDAAEGTSLHEEVPAEAIREPKR